MLKTVAKHHKEWIEVVQKLGGKHHSEDIVQEMYLKLYKYSSYDKCIVNGRVNKYYIFLTLRSITFSFFKEQKKIQKYNIDDFDIEEVEDTIEFENNWNDFINKVNKESSTWHWYDEQIFNMYKDNKTSFRKLANDTGISWVSIFHTVKNCEHKLKEKLSKDYEKIRQKD